MIMAAGASSRFDGCKLLADINGGPMLQHVISQVKGLVEDTFVVSGAWEQSLSMARERGALGDVTLIYSQLWRQGLGHSIAAGVAELASLYDGILVLLGDQVAVSADDIQKLLANFAGKDIACAYYAGKRGVPAVFGRRCFDQLRRLSGDQGAKGVLYNPELRVATCDMPAAAIDIDTEAELSRWLARSSRLPGL
ncbi:nucleotidyltransferase family protein [Microbulbifer sp. SA54]|uniref:nucleotidyltransferase family protein n=1 Tax=Microbulbifer sp. SA54 TaxID=3401577 RepID=UPI003AADEC1A